MQIRKSSQTPTHQKVILVSTENRLFLPENGNREWYITQKTAEAMGCHGGIIEKQDVIAFYFDEAGKKVEFRAKEKMQLFFPGHENLRDKCHIDGEICYKAKQGDRIGAVGEQTELTIQKNNITNSY